MKMLKSVTMLFASFGVATFTFTSYRQFQINQDLKVMNKTMEDVQQEIKNNKVVSNSHTKEVAHA